MEDRGATGIECAPHDMDCPKRPVRYWTSADTDILAAYRDWRDARDAREALSSQGDPFYDHLHEMEDAARHRFDAAVREAVSEKRT